MPRRLAIVPLLGLLVLAQVTAACGDDTTSDSPRTTARASSTGDTSLEGTLWMLASVGPSDAPVAPGTSPTLQFLADARYTADTGCNTVNGTYVTAGEDGLRLGTGQTTLRACADPAADQQEQALTQAFPAVRSYRRGGDRMALLDESGAVLLTYAKASTELPGTQWQVTGVNTGSAVESSALTEQLSLEFGATGQVSGSAGCNTFTGTYTVDGDQLTFDDLAATEMACEPEVMALEQAYLAALGKVTGVRRSGTSVSLIDESGATQVSLVPPSH